jgi:hypothetical protein
MRITPVSIIVSSLLFVGIYGKADEHDADHALESGLRATLNQRHVHVHVHHGIVTLDGHVPTEADRQRIETMVRNTAGVVALKDKLKVELPSPGTYGVPPTVPVYLTAPPEATPGTDVVTLPAPVIVPDYPKLRVQAWSPDDQPAASRIARELRTDAVRATGLQDVTITVRNGIISLKGAIDGQDEREALISAIQRAGVGKAIYDQLQLR